MAKLNPLGFPNVSSKLTKDFILKTMLNGMRTVLERETGIKNLPITFSERVREDILRKQKDRNYVNLPFGWLVMGGVTAERDAVVTKTMARHGLRAGMVGATRNTSKKAFVFPVAIAVELHYFDSDPDRLINMLAAFAILSTTDGLSFDLVYKHEKEEPENNFRLTTRMEIPQDFSIPLIQDNDPSTGSLAEITVGIIAHTWTGFFRDSLAVTSSAPITNISVEVAQGMHEEEGYEVDIDSNKEIDSYGD